MADTEQIEFSVLIDGDPVEYFTVAYSDTWKQSAVDEQRNLAIAYAKEHGGEVEERISYAQDRRIVWSSDDDEDDDDEDAPERPYNALRDWKD